MSSNIVYHIVQHDEGRTYSIKYKGKSKHNANLMRKVFECLYSCKFNKDIVSGTTYVTSYETNHHDSIYSTMININKQFKNSELLSLLDTNESPIKFYKRLIEFGIPIDKIEFLL